MWECHPFSQSLPTRDSSSTAEPGGVTGLCSFTSDPSSPRAVKVGHGRVCLAQVSIFRASIEEH